MDINHFFSLIFNFAFILTKEIYIFTFFLKSSQNLSRGAVKSNSGSPALTYGPEPDKLN